VRKGTSLNLIRPSKKLLADLGKPHGKVEGQHFYLVDVTLKSGESIGSVLLTEGKLVGLALPTPTSTKLKKVDLIFSSSEIADITRSRYYHSFSIDEKTTLEYWNPKTVDYREDNDDLINRLVGYVESDQARANRLLELAQMRLDDLRRCERKLSSHSRRIRTVSISLRLTTIALGALVATRALADRVTDAAHLSETIRMLVELSYAAMGVAIAVIGGIEVFFKFEKRHGELLTLAAQCHSVTRRYMSAYDVAWDGQKLTDTIRKYEKWIVAHNDELSSIYSKAATAGLNLVEDGGIDYSRLIVGSHICS